MSNWQQAILRITGGLDAAQAGFTTAQAKQAEFDALVRLCRQVGKGVAGVESMKTAPEVARLLSWAQTYAEQQK